MTRCSLICPLVHKTSTFLLQTSSSSSLVSLHNSNDPDSTMAWWDPPPPPPPVKSTPDVALWLRLSVLCLAIGFIIAVKAKSGLSEAKLRLITGNVFLDTINIVRILLLGAACLRVICLAGVLLFEIVFCTSNGKYHTDNVMGIIVVLIVHTLAEKALSRVERSYLKREVLHLEIEVSEFGLCVDPHIGLL